MWRYTYLGGGNFKMCDSSTGSVTIGPVVADKIPDDKWSHRSTGMRCRTCMWWVRKDDARLKLCLESEELGRCRRHAPTLGGWPVVYSIDWCGDHKLDGGKL